MSTLRTAIVDDEAPARTRVRDLLKPYGDIEIVFEAPDGKSAVEQVHRLRPTLLFLDIQMPELDGFGVLEALDRDARPGGVIFVTAYDVYAIRAFDVNAVDYLLKPYSADRFNDALARARARLENPAGVQRNIEQLLKEVSRRPQAPDRLAVKSEDGVRLVRVAEIDWLQAEGNYTVLHIGSGTLRTREALSVLAERLSPCGFLRVHRSVVVNADRIFRLEPWTHGEYVVVLRNGTKLNSSRAYGEQIRSLIEGG